MWAQLPEAAEAQLGRREIALGLTVSTLLTGSTLRCARNHRALATVEASMIAFVGLLLICSMPGLVLLLVVLAALDRMGLRSKDESGRAMAAPGIDELHAIFYATKRNEVDQRRTSLMMRDDEGDGAPPGSRIDFDAGTAVIRPGRGRDQR